MMGVQCQWISSHELEVVWEVVEVPLWLRWLNVWQLELWHLHFTPSWSLWLFESLHDVTNWVEVEHVLLWLHNLEWVPHTLVCFLMVLLVGEHHLDAFVELVNFFSDAIFDHLQNLSQSWECHLEWVHTLEVLHSFSNLLVERRSLDMLSLNRLVPFVVEARD